MPSPRIRSRGRVMASVPDATCSRSFRSVWYTGSAMTKSKSWPSRTVDDARATGGLGSEQLPNVWLQSISASFACCSG